MDATNRWSKVPTYTQSEAEEVPGGCVLPPLPVLLCSVFHCDAVDAVDTDTDDDTDDNEDCDRSRRRSGVFVHDEDENERKEDAQTHRRLFLLLLLLLLLLLILVAFVAIPCQCIIPGIAVDRTSRGNDDAEDRGRRC